MSGSSSDSEGVPPTKRHKADAEESDSDSESNVASSPGLGGRCITNRDFDKFFSMMRRDIAAHKKRKVVYDEESAGRAINLARLLAYMRHGTMPAEDAREFFNVLSGMSVDHLELSPGSILACIKERGFLRGDDRICAHAMCAVDRGKTRAVMVPHKDADVVAQMMLREESRKHLVRILFTTDKMRPIEDLGEQFWYHARDGHYYTVARHAVVRVKTLEEACAFAASTLQVLHPDRLAEIGRIAMDDRKSLMSDEGIAWTPFDPSKHCDPAFLAARLRVPYEQWKLHDWEAWEKESAPPCVIGEDEASSSEPESGGGCPTQ